MRGPYELTAATTVKYAKCPGQQRKQIGSNSTYVCNTTSGVNELKRGSNPRSCPVGNPVNVAAKDKYMTRTEFAGAGVFPITFTWSYNFRDYNASYTDADVLGHKRTHNYNNKINLKTVNTASGVVSTAFVGRPDNTTQLFNYNGTTGLWETTGDIHASLTQLTDGSGGVTGWEYIAADNSTEIYDATGLLQSITDPAGNVQTLNYQQGMLDEVSTNDGDRITFQYDAAGRISSLSHPGSGRVWGFRYTSNSEGGLLEYVDNPDGTTRRYHYNEQDMTDGLSIKSALTGITDERGLRFANYEYDLFDIKEGAVAISSYHGPKTPLLTDRIDGVSITYSGNTRTVTNSNGNASDYTRVVKQGVELISNISGPGCASCQGGVISYNYDSNTINLLSKTENGVTTEYGDYDAHGNPGYIIEARGTTEERRIDYTYHPGFFGKIVTITEPSVHAGSNRVTTYSYDNFGNRTSATVNGFKPDGSPVASTTTWQYNGPLHQLSQIDGPGTGVSDITTLRYHADDPNEGNNRARLKEIEDASGTLVRSNIQYSTTGRVISEDRPNGLSLGYSYYPGNDRLESLAESSTAGTRVTRWTYLATGEVESITTGDNSPAATSLTFSYDDARRLTRITDGMGNYLEFVLDTEGNVVSENIHDSTGVLLKAVNQAFDTYNQLNVQSQVNEAVDHDYAPDGTLDRQTDGYGMVTDYDYDALKRLTQTTRDQGGWTPATADSVTRFNYDAGDRLTQVVDPNNGTTTYIYGDLGNLLSQSSPDTGMTTFQYDAAGNRTQQTDARGQVITYTYDALNRLTGLDAPGIEDDVTYRYDSCTNGQGELCTVTLAPASFSPIVTDYGYTAFGEVADHQGVTYNYDEAGRVKTMTYPSGAIVTYSYGPGGQVIQVDLDRGGQVETLASAIQYAPFGPVTSLTLGNGLTLGKGVDQAYRTSGISLGSLLNETYQFDTAGNLTTVLDNLTAGQDRAFGYDLLSRVIAFSQGDGVTGGGPTPPLPQGGPLFSDKPALLASIQTMNNEVNMPPGTTSKPWLTTAVSSLTVDNVKLALERAEASPGAVNSAETLGYIAIANGVASSFIASDGQSVAFESRISSDGITGWGTCFNVVLAGNYSTPPVAVASQVTRDGGDGGWLRRCAQSNSSVGLTFDEDRYRDFERNHTTEQVSVLAFSRAFDAQLTDYDGSSWSLEAGQLTLNDTSVTPEYVQVSFQQTYSVPPVIVALPTNEGGEPSALRIRNVTTTGFEIVQVEPAGNNGPHFAMTVPYIVMERGVHRLPDGTWLAADVVDVSAVQHGSGVSGTPGWHTLVFPEQPSLPPPTGGSGDIEYGYDRNGNRLQLTEMDTSITDYTYGAASNRLTGYSGAQAASVTIDANGNITAIGSRTFSHNAANRFVSVLDGGATTATYRYNGLGQRIEKVTAQTTTAFSYSTNGQLLTEYQPNGAILREYVYLNGEPLAQLEPVGSTHEVLYLQTDHLGTPRMATDSGGTAVWKWESDPFGATAADTDPDGNGMHVTVNLRFPGQYYDQETGLHYNYFRYYDPQTGRYLTSDPIGLAGGLNTYGYVGGNPVGRTDPLGLDFGFVVNPALAGGNGHTTLYYQDSRGEWFAYDQGAAGAPSFDGDLGYLFDLPGGVSINPAASPPSGAIIYPTSSSVDTRISSCATSSRDRHNSGNVDYNLLSNNCTDAAVDVLSCANIRVKNPVFTTRPNAWLDVLKKNRPKICRSTRRGLRCSPL